MHSILECYHLIITPQYILASLNIELLPQEGCGESEEVKKRRPNDENENPDEVDVLEGTEDMPRHHQLTAERISTPTSQHNTTPSSAGVGVGPTPRQRAKQVRDSTKIHPSHLQEKAAPGMPGSNLPPLPAAMQHHAPPHAPAGPMPGLINPSMAQAIPGLQAQYMEMARRFLMQQEQQDKITKDQVLIVSKQ